MDDRYKKNSVATLAAIIVGVVSGAAMAGGLLDVDFGDANFSDFERDGKINNPYWPLNPDGVFRTFTYEAETEDGCIINKIYVNGGPPGGPSTTAKTVMGLDVLEVLDIEWIDEECDGNLEESEITFDWYAQDNFKNIWYMGEASRDFGDVEIDGNEVSCPSLIDVYLGAPIDNWDSPELFAECTAGSWEAGVAGGEGDEAVVGEAGIVVPSDMPFGPDGEPLSNGTYYMQEVAFEAEDMAKILRQGATLSVEDGVAPGDYDNCRKVKEWNPFEPGGSVEHKWYCHDQDNDYGPGLVLIEGIGGGRTEVETLVEIDPAY